MNPTLSQFGHDPWWITIIKIVAVFAFLVVMTLFAIWYERRVVARMQVRPGPNRVGPFGLLQSLADGLKLAFKEDIMPTLADKAVFFIAPVISTVCAFTAFVGDPVRPDRESVRSQDAAAAHRRVGRGARGARDCSAMGVYGIVLGGYASGSTYPLLGGLRSAAQVISYEVAMGLVHRARSSSTSGTLSTSGIVGAQQSGTARVSTSLGHQFTAPGWYAILLLPSLVIYFISAIGETNRAPFDLPEAESELVGGFHTEYSSLKFALFFLAEYINMVTVSGLCATLFFGGWHAPWPISLWSGAAARRVPVHLVHRQGAHPAVRLRLASRHHAPPALRPVHALRLEGPDPDQPGLDPGRRRRPGAAVVRHQSGSHRLTIVADRVGRADPPRSRRGSSARRRRNR